MNLSPQMAEIRVDNRKSKVFIITILISSRILINLFNSLYFSLENFAQLWQDLDPMLTAPMPSNPWISNDESFFDVTDDDK